MKPPRFLDSAGRWASVAVSAAMIAPVSCSGEPERPSGNFADSLDRRSALAPPPNPSADSPEVDPPSGVVRAAAWYAELPPELKLSLAAPWTGDLDGMLERRTVRVLTVYSDLFYFLDGVEQKGVTYEAAQLFEERLNAGRRTAERVQVLIVPVNRDRLISDLVEGRGDIAAANLTIIPERQAVVDFSIPVLEDVAEIVVTGPEAPRIESFEDLAGQRMPVRLSTSYYQSLLRLNDSLESRGLDPIELFPVGEFLEDVDMLEMVNAGIFPWVVADTHMAEVWAQVFEELELRYDLAVREGGAIGWAFRKESPALAAALNEFLREHRAGTLIGNILIKRYFDNADWVHNALGGADLARFQNVIDLIRDYSEQYGFDWLLVASLAYQESRLRHGARSRTGAIGVMQMLPSTGAEVGVGDISELESNVHAGVKYLRYLADRYFADAGLSELDRTLFTFAAYNAGAARIAGLRRRATALDLDPNRWFDHVELVAAREIGRETVQYVRNIYKYYVAYRLISDRLDEREAG